MIPKAVFYHTRFKEIYDMKLCNEIYILEKFLMVNYVQFNNDFKFLHILCSSLMNYFPAILSQHFYGKTSVH